MEKIEIRDREKSYLVLSKDFGKMRGFYKETPKTTPSDIGNVIEIAIERKWETNHIKSCRPKYGFHISNLGFDGVHKFLLILAFCKKQLPDGGGDGAIYRDLVSLVQLSEHHDPNILLFLCEARLLSLFQHWPERLKSTTLEKIKGLAAEHSLEELIKIQGIPQELYETTHLYFLQSYPWTNSSI